MTLRDQRQAEFAKMYINSNRLNILHLCPRFGKIYTSIIILKELKPANILICYPDEKIRDSWKTDFKTLKFDDSGVTYSTYLSLWKLVENSYDMIIMDEVHTLSEKQIESARELIRNNALSSVLGLSGTISKETEKTLLYELKLPILASYPIEQAIEEGVIVDYQITVVKVSLDTKIRLYKGKTEKQKFDGYTHVINRLQMEGKDTFFMRLSRMRLIQNSYAKQQKTIELLEKHPDERILVFAGVTKIADNLGIASYHSKSTEKKVFSQFVDGGINHLAVVKIGNSGITYKKLNRVIINYFNSNGEALSQQINRCTGLEYNNPDKKAHIFIITTEEPTELAWLKRALEFFDKEKIKYV